jgi:hypothetical protein
VNDGRRAVDCREDSHIVPSGDLAVFSHDACEGCALGRRQELHRTIIASMRVVAIELTELHVVGVHERARSDVIGRESDRYVVFEDGLAPADRAGGHFVAGRHLAAAGQPLGVELCSDRKISASDQDVIVLVEADHQPRSGLFTDFDHGGVGKTEKWADSRACGIVHGCGRAPPHAVSLVPRMFFVNNHGGARHEVPVGNHTRGNAVPFSVCTGERADGETSAPPRERLALTTNVALN